MKTLAVCTCLVASTILAAEPVKDSANLLKPTNQVDSWRLEQHEGGKGEIKAMDDALVLTTTEIDGTIWHVQAFQVGLDLKEGQRYVVSFDIKGDVSTVSLTAGIDEEDWHNIGLDETVYVTKEFKPQEYTFTATSVAAKNNRIGFLVGDYKGTVSVKNMVLKAK
jgi:hypothetical protein